MLSSRGGPYELFTHVAKTVLNLIPEKLKVHGGKRVFSKTGKISKFHYNGRTAIRPSIPIGRTSRHSNVTSCGIKLTNYCRSTLSNPLVSNLAGTSDGFTCLMEFVNAGKMSIEASFAYEIESTDVGLLVAVKAEICTR
ncbi:unnamed protein product [Allacma fusca]|uniref:Uncharacterized protein n=1 Tax=Allacma fusca TaxID=39272 RepID=A0A8J2K0D8_9HEXA|nr:unnamed protein product [Allacma fusca]